MTDTSYVPAPERRRAADLRTGDRIIPGDLVGATDAESVLGVHPFPDIDGTPTVMVVVRPDGREQVFSQYWRADASVALAADSGAYGRDVDNGDPAAVVPEGVAGQAMGRASVHTAEGGETVELPEPFWVCLICGDSVPYAVSQREHVATH